MGSNGFVSEFRNFRYSLHPPHPHSPCYLAWNKTLWAKTKKQDDTDKIHESIGFGIMFCVSLSRDQFQNCCCSPLTLSLSLSAGCRFQSHTFTFQLTLTYRKNVISKVCVESLLCGKSVDFSTSWKVPKNKKQRRYYLAVAQQKVFQTLLCLTNCWNENGKSWDRMPIRKNTILLLLTTLWVCTRAMNMGTNFRSKFKRSTGKESFNWSICWFLDSQIFLLFGCPLFNILTYSKHNITW